MKIYFNKLQHHLKSDLKPIYIISGDEPFQVQQALKIIRDKALQQGFSNRELFFVEKGFNWLDFSMSNDSLSLFSEKKILELRIPNAKPGKEGSKILLEFCDSLSNDTLLLIITSKLDRATSNTKWFKAISESGVAVSIWPIEGAELRKWLKTRITLRNLMADEHILHILEERVEGNLLAADQEIEKLSLLCPDGKLTTEIVEHAVADSARYDLYKLADEALKGKVNYIPRILYGLKAEGISPLLLNWSLSKEIRILLKMKNSLDQGKGLDVIFRQLRIWDSRKNLLKNALNRHSSASLQALLRKANRTDRIIKGNEIGNLWDELLQLSLGIAGLRYLPNIAIN